MEIKMDLSSLDIKKNETIGQLSKTNLKCSEFTLNELHFLCNESEIIPEYIEDLASEDAEFKKLLIKRSSEQHLLINDDFSTEPVIDYELACNAIKNNFENFLGLPQNFN